jgi:hypothetical protein
MGFLWLGDGQLHLRLTGCGCWALRRQARGILDETISFDASPRSLELLSGSGHGDIVVINVVWEASFHDSFDSFLKPPFKGYVELSYLVVTIPGAVVLSVVRSSKSFAGARRRIAVTST